MCRQNSRKIRARNTSGYRGTAFDKQREQYQAQIRINDKLTYLGYYDTELEAAIAYDHFVLDNNLGHTNNGLLGDGNVTFDKQYGLWKVMATKDDVLYHLGHYYSVVGAVMARRRFMTHDDD